MNKIICALVAFIPAIALSQWNVSTSVNTPVAIAANDQQDLRMASDGRGGAIITWIDYRTIIASADIYVQRIDSDGYVKWTANGIGICTNTAHQASPALVEDGKGGCIMVWQDWRSGERDIYAQRVDGNGNVKWAANGIGVSTKPGQQQGPKIISDEAGGAIITYEDSTVNGWDIYTQRIDSDGTVKWFAGGEMICTAAGDQINPKIEGDGTGNAFITWQDKRNAGTSYDIYCQKINSSGLVQWTANGIPVCTEFYVQNNPKIEPDGAGGVYIVWQDKRYINDYDIYIQRISSSGSALWTAGGVQVCVASGNQSAIDMDSEGINGVILTWKDLRSVSADVYAQRITLAGSPVWTTNGKVISNAAFDQVNPNIVGDGYGGAIIVWQDSTGNSWDAMTQRIDSSGNVLWGTNGIPAGNAANNQTSPKQISDGKGGAIYAFQDKRSLDFDIYAHHLNADGTSVISETAAEKFLPGVICYPNPFSEKITFKLAGSAEPEQWEIMISDIAGNKILQNTIINSNIFELEKGVLAVGIYFYEIIAFNGETNFITRGKMVAY